MGTPEEFKQKTTISWGLYAFSLFIAFNIGVLYATMLGSRDDIIENKEDSINFTEQEVGGLRSDWERQNTIQAIHDKGVIKRIEDLEKYHKE